jgi:hypothetical protein
LNNLHRTRFRRAAAVHSSAKGQQRVEEHGISAIGGSAAALVVGLTLGAFVLWKRGVLPYYRPIELALLLAAFALAGAILFAPVKRNRGRAGMGERQSDGVGSGPPRFHPLGGVAAR